MRANKKMQRLLKGNFKKPRAFLDKALESTLKSSLERVKGAVVLSHLRHNTTYSVAEAFDLTDYECAVNHIHIGDKIKSPSNAHYWLAKALYFSSRVHDKLQTFDKNGRYEFIISIDSTGGVVRFHKVRIHQQWLADDLDKFEDEAVLAFEGKDVYSDPNLYRWIKTLRTDVPGGVLPCA